MNELIAAVLGVLVGANATGAIWLWYSIKKATNLREALAADWELRQVGKAAPKGYTDHHGLFQIPYAPSIQSIPSTWTSPQTTTGGFGATV